MTPRAAREPERVAALDLALGHLGPAERAFRISRAVEMLARGGIDPDGLLVLADDLALRGVILCQAVPGAGGIVWPPALANRPPAPDLEDALVHAACGHLRRRGARLAQCLPADAEVSLAAPLLRNGFRHVTGLTYLHHDLSLNAPPAEGPSRLTFTPYDGDRPEAFHATLAETYGGTLDCPEVNGVRTIAEVVEGHQAQGRFDPSAWWLAWRDGRPAGVLLMVEEEAGDWEVAYMGVVPAARRRGVGGEVLRHALGQARLRRGRRVTLSVDDRNAPARRLYGRLGFEPHGHCEVLLAVLPSGGPV